MIVNTKDIPTPCFVIDEKRLIDNAKILANISNLTGSKVILALKAFSSYDFFPLIKDYLSGVSASSLNEARLGYEEFRKEVHIFTPGYTSKNIFDYLKYASHLSFNSFSQWKFIKDLLAWKDNPSVKCGIRINPEYSEIKTDIYNPSARHSRLGVTQDNFQEDLLTGITGLHFHALCGGDSYQLERVLKAIEKKFGKYLNQMEWLNFGGGHVVTKPGYNIEHLIKLIQDIQIRYNLQVILEPGEAFAYDAGYLVTSVVDIINNEKEIAILDTSVATHMPDVLEMPYRPVIIGADMPYVNKYTYLLGGVSCLAGDIVGEYSFSEPLHIGQKLIFTDMAHYTMVKTTFFNGISLPKLGAINRDGKFRLIREYGYKDFRGKL